MTASYYYLVEEASTGRPSVLYSHELPGLQFSYAIRREGSGELVFRFENAVDAFATLDKLNHGAEVDLAVVA